MKEYKIREPDYFHKGPARAEIEGKWCHVDENNKPIYKERYENVGPFSKGLAAVKKDGFWFHIHMNGSAAYEQKYDYVGSFNEGLARAKKDGRYFHISYDGNPSYVKRFDYVSPFEKGRALVRENQVWFYINANGEEVARYYLQEAIRDHFFRTWAVPIEIEEIERDRFINLAESRVGRLRVVGDELQTNIKDKHRPLTDLRDLAVISQDENQEVLAISMWDPKSKSVDSRKIKKHRETELAPGDYELFMVYNKEEVDKLLASKNKGQVV